MTPSTHFQRVGTRSNQISEYSPIFGLPEYVKFIPFFTPFFLIFAPPFYFLSIPFISIPSSTSYSIYSDWVDQERGGAWNLVTV
jgi:hypothetical protein